MRGIGGPVEKEKENFVSGFLKGHLLLYLLSLKYAGQNVQTENVLP